MPTNEALEFGVYPARRSAGNFVGRATRSALKIELDRMLETVDRRAMVANDPVELVRTYDNPHDQEVAGILVAMLAYGRVASIKAKARTALAALGPSPARAVDGGRAATKLKGFVYRFQRGDDVPRFLRAVGRVRRAYGSLGQAFSAGAGDEPGAPYTDAMDRFMATLAAEVRGVPTYGLRFLLPRTQGQGAAKRLCLYLRWMIRPDDGVDLGAWGALTDALDPGRLVMPLDTHIARIGRYLGLTARASNDMKTALEITAALRELAPHDPLLYDMALCHLGISGACPQRRDPVVCQGCGLRRVCQLGPEPRGWKTLARRPR